jgi:NAD(P)-dependent dehydrogenase (short-subunit alcohol dehydrogenase family)
MVHDVGNRERWTEIATELATTGRLPRLLINNAGVAAAGRALDVSDKSWEEVIHIDLWGVIYGCREFVPRMLATAGQSAVLNVASCAAYVGLPMGAPYSIAKAGVLRLTQSLQSEIDPKQVSFTCLCPGSVHTGIWDSAARLGTARPEAMERIAKFAKPDRRTPSQVASRAIRGVLAGRAVINVYSEAWLLDLITRLLPAQWLSWANRRFFMWKFPEMVYAPIPFNSPGAAQNPQGPVGRLSSAFPE